MSKICLGQILDKKPRRCYTDVVQDAGRDATAFSIAAVARLSGLSADTIRSWERRYGLIRPRRDRSGVRAYTQAEIARLTLARRATELGHPIRKIAALDDRAITALLDAKPAGALHGAESPAQDVVAALLEALRGDDYERLKRGIVSAATLMDSRDLVLRVFVPLLHEAGALWQQGSLSIWQEHLLSELIRAAGAAGRFGEERDSDDGMVFATPPHELHAFGAAFAAIIASSRGYRVHNLGADVPVAELIDAAKRLNVRYVVIGITQTNSSSAEFGEYLQKLDRALPRAIEVWVGGPSSKDLVARASGRRLRAIATLEEFADAVEAERTSATRLRQRMF